MGIEILYTSEFIHMYGKLEEALQEEVREKISLLKERKNHPTLHVHKLKGKLRRYHSFSVNYKFRIIFEYSNKNIATLLIIGNHDIYK